MFKVGQLVMRLMTLPSGRREATLERVESARDGIVRLKGYNLAFEDNGQQIPTPGDCLGKTELIPLGCDEAYLAGQLQHVYKAVVHLWVRPASPVLGSSDVFTVEHKCEVTADSEEEAEQKLQTMQFSNEHGDQLALKEIVSVWAK